MTFFFFYDRERTRSRGRQAPRWVETWRGDNEGGLWTGPSDAKVVITEFIDFQCRYCSRLVAYLDSIKAEFPGTIAVVFHHFPLRNHPVALPAAVASECAHRQGRFAPFMRLALAQQDSLGKKPWSRFAEDVGILDGPAFDECVALPPDSFPRISNGREIAERTGARGTPTVWVNGMVASRLDLESLRYMVVAALDKKEEDEAWPLVEVTGGGRPIH
jgi:protein-disulfide isomerase